MSTSYGNQFLSGYVLQTTAESAYDVPGSSTKQVIANARVENYGVIQETFTLWMVPQGETNDDQYKAVIDRAIDPGETITLFEIINEPMLSGAAIWAEASSASVLSMTVGGSITTPD